MILEFRGVEKRSRVDPGRPLFSDLSFAIGRGVSVGILGGRGSGKTTLIDMALGAVPPDAGRITRAGRLSMPIGSPGTLSRHLSAEDNCRFTARAFNLDAESFCRFVEKFSDLGPLFRRPVSYLNASKRAQLTYTLTYAVPADCYVSDGGLWNGGEAFRERCRALAHARRRQAAFLFATASVRDVSEFADIAGVIHEGKITFYDTVPDAVRAFRALGHDEAKAGVKEAQPRTEIEEDDDGVF